MSGFAYVIIKSIKVSNSELIRKLDIGKFISKGFVSAEETFTSGIDDELWISQYNGSTIIYNFDLCSGVYTENFGDFEEKLSQIFPNVEIGSFIFSDTSNTGGYYLIRNGIKVVVRCWDFNELNKGSLEPFELELEKSHPLLSNEAKPEIYTCEAVNSMLGIKPYHSEEFLTEMKFEVFAPVDNSFENYRNLYRNEIFKKNEIGNSKENLKNENQSFKNDENIKPIGVFRKIISIFKNS